MPIVGSVYFLLGGTAPATAAGQGYQLWGALITESSSLAFLWYVMGRQGKSWKDIGWSPCLRDVPRALGLFLLTTITTWVVYFPIQFAYHAYSNHFLTQKSLDSMFGFGISIVSIAFVCLNPFFEELIVRAYTISEITNLGATRSLAIAISVALQLSYHLYQGVSNVFLLAMLFTVFSIYYTRTRRIVPIILVHLGLDLFALLRGKL
jgi:membrane protease YdiL (CAAX protease family)